MPAGSIPTPAARTALCISPKFSRVRATSMIWQTSSRLTVRPASSPRPRHSGFPVVGCLEATQVPWRTLSSSATRRLVLRSDGHVTAVEAADGQYLGMERRAVLKRARSMVPRRRSPGRRRAPFLVSVRPPEASELTTSASILTPPRRRTWTGSGTAVAEAVTIWVSTSRRRALTRAMERVLGRRPSRPRRSTCRTLATDGTRRRGRPGWRG